MAQSRMDYGVRGVALAHLDFETRSCYGIHTAGELAHQLETGSYDMSRVDETDAEAVEMANMFNSVSYANHITVSTRDKYVSLFTGVILDPILDEEELECQLKILLSTGCRFLPLFVGNNPANMSPKEHFKAFLDGSLRK